MGNCCRVNFSKQEFNDQLLFQGDEYVDQAPDGTLIKLKGYNTRNLINIETSENSLNINFKRIIKEQAEIISSTDFDNILSNHYPNLNHIPFPESKLPLNSKNLFSSQPIKFPTGEIYSGMWNSKNQRHGYGIGISAEGTLFKGLWENDRLGNFGIFMEKNGDYYMGDFKDGKFEGQGELEVQGKFRYKGNFKNDVIEGKGWMENFENGTKYEGDWKEGEETGTGVLIFPDGTRYKGDFKNGLYNGNGTMIFINGDRFEGEFVEGCIKGKGKYEWNNGEKYEGDYEDFMKNGYGKFFWNEDKFYEGMWLNNKQHGKGTIHYKEKVIEGMFRFGKIIKGS